MVVKLYVYPSIAQLWARVDGKIHSLLYVSWSCGSCIWLFTAMLRFSYSEISITVNVKCHCQQNPANQLPRTTGNIGRSWCKSSNEVWFGPGLKNSFMVMSLHGGKSNVVSTAKNRALKFVCWSHIFRFLKCEQAFVSAWLLCFFVLFTSTVQKSQALSQYRLNKVSKAAGSRCRISIM